MLIARSTIRYVECHMQIIFYCKLISLYAKEYFLEIAINQLNIN